MALSYQTGSVVGLSALYDALVSFLTGIGWTVAETVTTRDKVIKSNGTDGKVNMVYRLMGSAEAANPFSKWPNNPHKIFPYMMVMGYGTWTPGSPGSGTEYYGQVGPQLWGNATTSGFVADSVHIHRFNGTFPLVSPADTTLPGRTRRANTASCYENPFWAFDGRRKFLSYNSVNNTQVGWADVVTGESNSGSGGIPPQAMGSSPLVLVHDAATDKDFVYVLNGVATLSTQWLRYDIEANAWNTLAAPLWTAANPQGGTLAWDGADTIYALQGSSTTNFAKYSISGNSWTTLTAAPVVRPTSFTISGSGANSMNMIYVPNSLTGLGQDVIYAIVSNTGTVIYRYDVTSNAWRSTSGTGALTAQQAVASNAFIVRNDKYLIFSSPDAAPGTWYRADLSSGATIDATWTSMGSVQSALRLYTGLVNVNHVPAKVRSHATFNTTYWFLGDADSVTVVVKVGAANAHYYWLTFGRYNGSNRTDVMTTTASVSAGSRVSVAVDDTSKYSAGEPVLFWDPSTGTIEAALIFSIVDSTHFLATVVNSYTAGTRVAIDPTQWGAGGNGFFMCPTDPLGNGSDNEPAQYFMEPLPDSAATLRSSPGKRGLYQPVPISIWNNDAGTAKNETRGFVRNTFALSTGAYPAVQAEEQIKIAGKTYVFFPDTETSKNTVDTRGVLIGPID